MHNEYTVMLTIASIVKQQTEGSTEATETAVTVATLEAAGDTVTVAAAAAADAAAEADTATAIADVTAAVATAAAAVTMAATAQLPPLYLPHLHLAPLC